MTFRAEKVASARSHCFSSKRLRLRKILRLEHRLLQLEFCQKLRLLPRNLRVEPGVLLLQLRQPSGLLYLHSAVLLPPAVIRRRQHIDDAADVGDTLALDDQLFGSFELADDLLYCVLGAFHGGGPGPGWADKDSHSPLRFAVTMSVLVAAC